ncbi:MAG: hypothetical protein II937_14275 [Bacteroidales bacterium]|nr:hypothetical protein [Bacteroidales bacterium]
MKALKILSIIFTAVFVCNIAVAQRGQFLTESAKKRGAEKVKQMTDYIAFIADKSEDYTDRVLYKNKAVKLFIQKCEPYTENFDDGHSVYRQGVTMEVTSLRTRRVVRTPLMKEYLTNLLTLNYDQVKIESTELSEMQVSNLHLIRDNGDEREYSCTVYFEQAFQGYRDGRLWYKDITRKSVKCQIIANWNELDKKWETIVRLGDVHALDTRAN